MMIYLNKGILLTTSVLLAVLCHSNAAAQMQGTENEDQMQANIEEVKTPAWKHKTGGQITGSAEVVGDRVYFGSEDGTLHAVDVATGKAVWTYNTGGRIASKPAHQNGTVFVLSEDGKLYALNAENGDLLWEFETEGERKFIRYSSSTGEPFDDIWDYYLSGPALSGGMVFFGSGDHHVYAVDVGSGQLRWKFKTGDVVHATPLIDDGVVYIGSFDGIMYALDQMTGKPVWEFDTIGAAGFPSGVIQRRATIHEGWLYFGSRDYNLYVLDAKTGKGVWNYKAASWIISPPLIHEGKVYYSTSSSKSFNSHNIETSSLNWIIDVPEKSYSTPLFRNNMVLEGNFDGHLYGHDPETGQIIWKFQTEGSRKHYSTVFQEDGSFQPSFQYRGTMEERASIDKKRMMVGSIVGDPAVHGNLVLFGSTDSTFYAVELPEEM